MHEEGEPLHISLSVAGGVSLRVLAWRVIKKKEKTEVKSNYFKKRQNRKKKVSSGGIPLVKGSC
jgi:small neutral amino acid transporter SnatA (MarC family)